MKIKTYFLFSLFAGLILASCAKDFSPVEEDAPKVMRPLTAAEKKLVDSDRKFGLKLFKAVVQEEADKNIFISPLSVSMALGMTLNGASGETYQAMQQTLEFADLSNEDINKSYRSLIDLLINLDEKVLFEIANSIWYREEFQVEQDFLETNHYYFDATILPKDFTDTATITAINNWVKEKTHEKITEIIDSIDPFVVMFLINAIYFKGTWQYEFEKEKTTEAPFYLLDGSSSNCQLMQIEGDFNYYQDGNVKIIDLPYGDGNFSMTVFLPKQSDNLDAFIDNLNDTQWDHYLNSLSQSAVLLELPKFKLEYKLEMKDVLSALGMAIAFAPGGADFSRINPLAELFISKVLHKTFVQVDEEGTEAAAVTVVEISLTSTEGGGFHMRVDRPFFFVLREHQSRTILFMGKILQPEWTE